MGCSYIIVCGHTTKRGDLLTHARMQTNLFNVLRKRSQQKGIDLNESIYRCSRVGKWTQINKENDQEGL